MMKLYHGDCRLVMNNKPENSIDAIVTDPPYGLVEPRAYRSFRSATENGRTEGEKEQRRRGFMGKAWDGSGIEYDLTVWSEALRIAKPGSYLLAFGGTRTFHRLTCAIEDAGWEIKDCLMWLHGQGFPKHKSLLKPAWEPIVLAKKPGTGVLQIDACRIGDADTRRLMGTSSLGLLNDDGWEPKNVVGGSACGRWPANVILDEFSADILDAQTGITGGGSFSKSGKRALRDNPVYGVPNTTRNAPDNYGDSGGASRFYYVAKASKRERALFVQCGCEGDTWQKQDQNPPVRTDTTSHGKGISENGSEDECASPTMLFGSRSMEKSRTDTTSITGIKTNSTTTSATSNYLPNSTTNASTEAVSSAKEPGGNRADCAESSNLSKWSIGTSAAKDGLSTGDVVPATSRKLYEKSVCEKCGQPYVFEGHPTQKPVDVMRWLVRLVTPPGGVVLDPFAGSGTTGVACREEGFSFIGIEQDIKSVTIASHRIGEGCEVAA